MSNSSEWAAGQSPSHSAAEADQKPLGDLEAPPAMESGLVEGKAAEAKLRATRVARSLGCDPESTRRLIELSQRHDPADFPLPTAANLRAILLDFCDASHEDARSVAAARPEPGSDLWWVASLCYQDLLCDMGGTGLLRWPVPPRHLGPTGALVTLYPILAAIPLMRDWHAERGITEAQSKLVCADIGEKLRFNRRLFGMPSLDVAFWFSTHVRGSLYQLGRLQFDVHRGMGGFRLGIHIRAEGGPFTKEACEESVAQAREFFPARFPQWFGPDQPVKLNCTTWMLDPQLADWLPPESNVVRFGDFFRLTAPSADAQRNAVKDIWRFVYATVDGENPTPVARLPRDSRMRKRLAEAMDSGVRFQVRTGLWINESLSLDHRWMPVAYPLCPP
ncbi:acyltransferase domain-containing protein [Natronoglycomyces albus]|uniref:DUF5596 domain-containing protein n=1 Tax=Natronoglycomyces albus TaxID=2811108 RepID=A0A895XH73_9ACTN|nr:acyltransferase domain-containing protein [Natronoglycomyces albus]QSB04267.1 DUF5596 domain-containing protein [Natronoglycomyces albus]